MFNITFFTRVKPHEFTEQLRTIKFSVDPRTEDIYWKGDNGELFMICPFRNQGRKGVCGYRLHSDYPISTIVYLFNGAFGWIDDLKVSGIEHQTLLSKSKDEHFKDIASIPSVKTVDSRGVFIREDAMIILLNDKLVVQRRTKLKKINEELRKIEDIRDLLLPSIHDLFSFLEKESVG